jgi:23S rRNA (adenine2030-N6)-methyltransferase
VNYRHAFHAGNFADVLKHAVLARIVAYLGLKPAPFRYLDTHAGAGVYDLSGEAAARTGEWQAGIGRLHGHPFPPAVETVLEPYRQALTRVDPEGTLRLYPGSPEVVRSLAREQDRLLLVEKHPEEAAALRYRFGSDERVRVVERDGWTALGAFLPPKERRGLVLVDPPFEEPGEFSRLRDGLATAHRKWSTGTYMLWYPIKDVLSTEAFGRDLRGLSIPRILRAELYLRRPRDRERLNGAGLILVNPPWTLEADLKLLLPALAARLGEGEGSRGRLDRITAEAEPQL